MKRGRVVGRFIFVLGMLSGGLGIINILVTAQAVEKAQNAPTARRVRVLFLGDQGHHTPLERARQLFGVMGQRGIDLTYTENLADLNAKTLGQYDCLFVYANIASVSKDQEQAILDYVESGHGFAPIHCGSACFGNSDKLIALMGGRFKSHSTGVFKETIVDADHPVMKGLKPIESWDETYVHDRLNEEGRTLLAMRVEGDHKEPWTWVRTQGKGRVFYTAWGHDERTWSNAGFQDLIERGIRWSAGDWAMDRPSPSKTFAYVDAKVPNYLPTAPGRCQRRDHADAAASGNRGVDAASGGAAWF